MEEMNRTFITVKHANKGMSAKFQRIMDGRMKGTNTKKAKNARKNATISPLNSSGNATSKGLFPKAPLVLQSSAAATSHHRPRHLLELLGKRKATSHKRNRNQINRRERVDGKTDIDLKTTLSHKIKVEIL